jgi:hypothetical protein
MEALGNAINEYVAALRSATEPVFDVLAEAGQRHHAEKRAELEAKKAAFDAQMDKRWGK